MISLPNPPGEFWYGLLENPVKLPDGWEYVDAAGKWAQAKDPDGKMWLTNGRGLMTEASTYQGRLAAGEKTIQL